MQKRTSLPKLTPKWKQRFWASPEIIEWSEIAKEAAGIIKSAYRVVTQDATVVMYLLGILLLCATLTMHFN